jgi:hypothetical protein
VRIRPDTPGKRLVDKRLALQVLYQGHPGLCLNPNGLNLGGMHGFPSAFELQLPSGPQQPSPVALAMYPPAPAL